MSSQLKPEQWLADIAAAIAVVRHAGRVGVIGFCWGGKIAYLTACDLAIAALSPTTAAASPRNLRKAPKCPVMYHFGDQGRAHPA